MTDHGTLTIADALARMYDVDLQDDPGDLDLYLALAARTGGPILELGVGSGRLAVPLARAGHAVTGVDLDPAMLRRCRESAARAGRRAVANLTLIEGDARDLPPAPGPFALVFVALNSLLVFGSRDDQRRTLRAMAGHLAPGGLAVIDVWLPDADDLARYDGRLGLEYTREDPETGHLVTKFASAYHDAATGTVDLTAIFDVGVQGEPPRRWVRHDRLRLIGADELSGFAEDAGLTIEVLAGGYDLSPIAPGDDRAVLVSVRNDDSPARRHRRLRRSAAGTSPRADTSTDKSGLL